MITYSVKRIDAGARAGGTAHLFRGLDAGVNRARKRRAVPVGDPPEGRAPTEPESDPELWASVRRLPEKQRSAVALRFVADLSHREIATALGCSEDAARQNLREGLKKLRTEWT